MENNSFSILIGGDFVIDQVYESIGIGQDVKNLFSRSNLNIVNLEAPVTDSLAKIDKTGPNLKAHRDSTKQVLEALKVNVVTLANNHVLDYGTEGLKDTLAFCSKSEIQTVGAGRNLKEANCPLFLKSKEGRISIINFAENEWTNATAETAGANPMDIIDNIKSIQNARKEADVVLVIVHGGNEYNHYPSPRMVKQYRFYAECGADAVIGHHSHCVSGYEIHLGVPIFYSLGNFLFTTKKPKFDSWYSGLVVRLNILKEKVVGFEVIPVSQSKRDHSLSVMTGKAKVDMLSAVDEINRTIADDGLLNEKWIEFVRRVQSGYIKTVTPLSAVNSAKLRSAIYRTGLYRILLRKTYLMEHLNRIRCEAHNDVTKQLLMQLLHKCIR